MKTPAILPVAALVLSAFAATAQAQDCSFSLGPDTTLCNGQYVNLHAPSGALSIEWQNGFNSQIISATETGTYWCMATFPQTGTNIVVNGDFSMGDTLFSTDFVHGTGGAYGELSLEGTYAITTDPSLVHTNFSSCGDHTGGGPMLVVNGSPLPNADIWCQTVNVVPNTNYAFSAWLMSTTPGSPAIMDFLVNGVSLGTPLLASSTTCEWDQFYAVWNSDTATTATICIINQQLAVSGNDFALDDITFSALCSYTDSVQVTVLPPAPTVTLGDGDALCPGETAEVTATLDPADWPLTDLAYSWSTGAQGPSITVTEPGTYTVNVTGRCVDKQASVTFWPDVCETDLVMPNVFSPNGDGVNDGFGPIVNGDPDGFRMEIRNRWGQVVFTSSAVNNRWNGRAEGGPVPAGTYFWTIRYGKRMPDGSVDQREEAGTVTLLDSH
jgi:gliding motility-associated-like protein